MDRFLNHKIMIRLLTAFPVIFFGSVLFISAEWASTEISEDIYSALNKTGSFYAEYTAVSGEQEIARIVIVVDRKENLIASETEFLDSSSRPKLTSIMRILGPPGLEQEIEILQRFGDQGKKWRFRISDLLDREMKPDRPLGIVFRLAGALQAEIGDKLELAVIEDAFFQGEKKQLFPTVELELTQHELLVSVGYLFESKEKLGIDVSWLNPSIFEEAESITINDSIALVELSNGRQYSYDLQTGLLLEQKFPVSGRPDPRKIQKTGFSSFGNRSVPNERIPNFELPIDESQISNEVVESLRISIIISLLEDGELWHDIWSAAEEKGEDLSERFHRNGRYAGREFARKVLADDEFRSNFRNIIIGEARLNDESFRSIEDTTFEDSGEWIFDVLSDERISYRKSVRDLLDLLNEHASENWNNVYNIGIDEYLDGWTTGVANKLQVLREGR